MKIPYYGAGILFWTKDVNDNIFIEYIAICAFIISSICFIKLTEIK